MKVKLSHEEKEMAIQRIRDFYLVEKDEDMGIIGASLILDFFLEELAPMIYNNGLSDARKWFMQKLEDVDFAFDDIFK